MPQYWHGSVVIFQSTHPSGVRLISMPQYLRLPNFNPRTPVGCDKRHRRRKSLLDNFNPRTPVGCDALMIGPICSRKISIHAPQWGATRVADAPQLAVPISIHAPQWGATSRAVFICKTMVFQSTHPSGVRLRARSGSRSRRDFNPRTPVGCDDALAVDLADDGISIHAPQWGATRRETRCRRCRDFNPRTPVGCDHARAVDGVARLISIHAPQWGATWCGRCRESPGVDFNPRTPVGCDVSISMHKSSAAVFQSTHPSGVRLAIAYNWLSRS